jgi:RimJ/RimL family protein N-acetyltransferase
MGRAAGGAAKRTGRDVLERLPWGEVALTPLEEADIDLLHVWQNDPELRDLTMQHRGPIPRETVRDWLAGLRAPGQASRLVYMIRRDGQGVGLVQLIGLSPVQRRAEVGVFLGAPERRGAGLGFMALVLLIDFAFHGLDLRKLSAEVMAANRTTLRLCERLGFVREGLRRQEYFAAGAVWDVHVLGLLRDEFAFRPPPGARRLVGWPGG